MKAKSIVASAAAIVLGFALVASAASYTFSNYLSVGSTGADVTALQNFLIANGYSIPSISSGAAQPGYFGTQTQSAVKAYQAANSIPNTGFVGPLTVASLNKGGTAVTGTGTGTGSVSMACPAGFTCTPIVGTTVTTTGTVAAPTGITTPGISGTLTISNSGSVANGATFNTGQTVNIAGFKLQAGPSDMQVNTITADFNVRPWLYFGTFSLVNQTTGQVLVPSIPLNASSFTELTASEDYRLTISGLNFVVPKGQTVNVVLSGTALSGISQNTGAYLDVIAASVRSVDGTGVVDTENLPLLNLPYPNTTSPYASVLYSGNQTANLIVSIDGSSPQTQIIQTQSGSVTNNVPLAIYDIQAQNNAATLQGLTLNVGVSGGSYTPASVFNTIQLQANGMTYYGTLSGNTVVFNSSVSIPLPLGVTVPLKIVANVNQGVTGVTATTSLNTASTSNFVGVDANYNTPTVNNAGTIVSAVTTFSTTAAFSVVPGVAPSVPSYTPTTVPNGNGNVAVQWPFTFTVQAGTSPIYISATPKLAATYIFDLTGNAASSSKATGITSATTVTGDTNNGLGTAATGSFYVPSNQARTFTINVLENNSGNAPDSGAITALTGIYYSSVATASGATSTSQSLYTLPSQVQSPSVSLTSL